MIEFPDVSHYQSGLQLAGALACVAKSTEGTAFVDSAFRGFRSQAQALGIPFSAYHWINTTDPVSQARACFKVVGQTPVMWDAEAPGATVPAILAATAELKRLGGHAWGAYLPRWWWRDHLGSPDLRPLAAAGLALVSSDYRTNAPGVGWLPYGGVTPLVWQFSDNHPFNGQLVDFNRFMGTQSDLAALFAGQKPPIPARPTGDKMIIFCIDGKGALWRCDGTTCIPVADTEITDQTYVYAGLGEWSAIGSAANAVGPAHLPAIPVRPGDKRLTHLTVYAMGAFGTPLATSGGGAPVDVTAVAKATSDEIARRMLS